MNCKKIFRGQKLTDEEKIFVRQYVEWKRNIKQIKGQDVLIFKKLKKILLQTSDAVKISLLKREFSLPEFSSSFEILKSIDWSKQSSRTKLYLIKSMYKNGFFVLSESVDEAVEMIFGNLAKMREAMKFFGFEVQVEFLLMCSFRSYGNQRGQKQRESEAIIKEIMEDPRTTSKILFELGYYTLAGLKYYDECQDQSGADTERFIEENGYSEDRFAKITRKIDGVLEDDYHYTIKERFEKLFKRAYLNRRDRSKLWEFISYPKK